MKNKLSFKFFKDKRKYVLIKESEERSKFFGELNVYISNLMKQLWENPKNVSIILINSSSEDIKNNLADFFANNFYENILSSKCIENNLLYLITLLLKYEINNLLSPDNPDIFLNSTNCGYFLERLIDKKELKLFFRIIFDDVIEKLKNDELTFELEKMNKCVINNKKKINKINIYDNKKENKKENKNENKNEIIFERDILDLSFKKNNEENDDENNNSLLFNSYVKSLNEKDLKLYIKNNEEITNFNNNFKEFTNDLINTLKSSSSLYDTKIFLKYIIKQDMFNFYKSNYFKISEYFDILFNNLINNLNILPYSIKCICKIISKLIEARFPNIKNYQKNAFISKFFFYNLFFPLFLEPGYLALINDFINSKIQGENLLTMVEIMKKFVLGKLFINNKIEGLLTPFNWLFIEKMPKLIEFLEKTTNVKLPNFIEELIDGKLNEDYKYDYFEENKNEGIFHSSICFSTDDFYILFKNIEKCKEKLFKENNNKELELTIRKLLKEEHIRKINNFKNKKEFEIIKEEINDEIRTYRTAQVAKKPKLPKEKNILINFGKDKEKEILKFFIITNLFFKNEYKKIIDINNERLYFNIRNDIKDNNNIIEIDENKAIINKVKNFLCAILYHYNTLNREDFDENKITNIINILNEIKKNMKSLNILIDETIPSDWYIDSLLELLQKLPKQLINNDYKELFIQLEEDIKSSINNLHFDEMSLFMDKIKLAKKLKKYYDDAIRIMMNVRLNLKLNYIVKKTIIPTEITFRKNFKHLMINPISDTKEKDINNNNIITNINKKDNISITCSTIEDFTNKFPYISYELLKKKVNCFVVLRNLDFPGQINKYIHYINKKISKEKVINGERVINEESELNILSTKIYDYIMEKIYTKIFPLDLDPIDNMVYLNCKKVSWIEPKHLIKGKNHYIFSNFILDVTDFFKKIDKEKCPRKKFFYLEEIFKSIYNLNIFNGDKIQGIDDEIQILNYALIKAKPKTLNSNCEYMKLFLGNKKGKKEDNNLMQILGVSSQIIKLNYTQLINITEGEYYEKCKKNCLEFI